MTQLYSIDEEVPVLWPTSLGILVPRTDGKEKPEVLLMECGVCGHAVRKTSYSKVSAVPALEAL